MLYRTPYLTAAQLGITEDENQALAEVQRRLETGELRHAPDSSEELCARGEELSVFNMTYAHCGTAACLGGWMAYLLGYRDDGICGQLSDYVYNQERLYALFYPWGEVGNASRLWCDITAEQAAEAVRHFRMTGDADEAWRLALAE